MASTPQQSPRETIAQLWQQAKDLQEQGKSDAVLEVYRSILELDDRYLPALHKVAQICESHGAFAEAIEAYQKAIEVDDEPPFWVYRHLGFSLSQNGELERATEGYQTAIELQPEDVATYNLLGQAQGKHGDFEGAIEAYQKAIELQPEQPSWVYLNLGEAFSQTGRVEEAIAAYEKALALEPENAGIRRLIEGITVRKEVREVDRTGLAQQLQQQGKLDEALAEYRAVLAQDGSNLAALHQVGLICEGHGKWDEAVEAYRKAVKVDAEPPFWVYRHLGFALSQNGDLDGAVEAYEKAVELNSQDEATYHLLGQVCTQKGDLKGAIASYQNAIEIGSDSSTSVYLSLGEGFSQTGQLDQAICTYQKALKVYPNHLDFRILLEQAQAQKNKKINQDIDILQKSSSKELEHRTTSNNNLKVDKRNKSQYILLISNEAPPLKDFLTTAPGLRSYGLAVGLQKHGFRIKIVAPINFKFIGESSNFIFSSPKELDVDYIDMKHLSTYIINQCPEVCIFTNFIQYLHLPSNIKEKVKNKRIKFIYDLFAPKILEFQSSNYFSKQELQSFIERKKAALSMSDAICVNGNKKINYILGFLSQNNIDIAKPIIQTNMCLPSTRSIQGDRETKRSSKLTFLLGGRKQAWNYTSIDYVQLIEKISNRNWKLVNVGAPSLKLYEYSPFLEKTVLHNKVLHNFDVVDYYDYQKILNKVDIAIDLFEFNRERQLAMVTRSVVALSAGLPLIHHENTEVSTLLKEYDAGWLYKKEEEIFGILDWIAAHPESVQQKKANALKLFNDHFIPEVAVSHLSQLIQEWEKKEKFQSDHSDRYQGSISRDIFLEKWYVNKHKLNNKIWNAEIENVYEYFLNSEDPDKSAPNFLLDFIRDRKKIYNQALPNDSFLDFRKLSDECLIDLCSFWIDIPWYITQNKLKQSPKEAIAHYFNPINLLEKSPNRFFNEKWYRKYYPEVQEMIDLGFCTNGFHHFLCYGAKNKYSPSLFFNEEFYIKQNSDVEQAVRDQIFVCGFEHFMIYAKTEKFRASSASPVFDYGYYVKTYPSLGQVKASNMTHDYQLLIDFIDRGLYKGRWGSLFHKELYSGVTKFPLQESINLCNQSLREVTNDWGNLNLSQNFITHLKVFKDKTLADLVKKNNYLQKIILHLES